MLGGYSALVVFVASDALWTINIHIQPPLKSIHASPDVPILCVKHVAIVVGLKLPVH